MSTSATSDSRSQNSASSETLRTWSRSYWSSSTFCASSFTCASRVFSSSARSGLETSATASSESTRIDFRMESSRGRWQARGYQSGQIQDSTFNLPDPGRRRRSATLTYCQPDVAPWALPALPAHPPPRSRPEAPAGAARAAGGAARPRPAGRRARSRVRGAAAAHRRRADPRRQPGRGVLPRRGRLRRHARGGRPRPQREILLESYIFKDDATGRSFLEELAAAAARGVAGAGARGRPRLVLHPRGRSGRRWSAAASRSASSIPSSQRLWYQPFRDHRKILVVDRRVAFTGGMNIGEEYGSSSAERRARPGATPTCGSRARRPGRWRWSSPRAGSTRAASRSSSSRCRPRTPRPRGAHPGARLAARTAGQPRRRRPWPRSWPRPRRTLWITNAYFAPGSGRGRASWGRPPRAAWTCGSCCPARPTCRSSATPGTATTRGCSRAGVRIFEYQDVDPARQDPGGRRLRLGGGLDQPRLPLLPLQRRVRPADALRRGRRSGWRRPSRRTCAARSRSTAPTGAAGPRSRSSWTAWPA